jgi:hypothetical protein
MSILNYIWRYRLQQYYYWFGWFSVFVYAALCGIASYYSVYSLNASLGLVITAGLAGLVANVYMFFIIVPVLLHRSSDPEFSLYHKTRRAYRNGEELYLKVKIKNGDQTYYEEVSDTKKRIINMFAYGIGIIQSLLLTCFFLMFLPDAFADLFATELRFSDYSDGVFQPFYMDLAWGALIFVIFAISMRCNWTLTVYGAINYLNRHDFTLENIANVIKKLAPREAFYKRDIAHLSLFAIVAAIGTYGLYGFFNAATFSTLEITSYFFSLGGACAAVSGILITIGIISYLPFATMAAFRGAGFIIDAVSCACRSAWNEIDKNYQGLRAIGVHWSLSGIISSLAAIILLPFKLAWNLVTHPADILAAINAVSNGVITQVNMTGNSASSMVAGTGAALGSWNTYVEGRHRKDDAIDELPPYIECELNKNGSEVTQTNFYMWDSKTSFAKALGLNTANTEQKFDDHALLQNNKGIELHDAQVQQQEIAAYRPNI